MDSAGLDRPSGAGARRDGTAFGRVMDDFHVQRVSGKNAKPAPLSVLIDRILASLGPLPLYGAASVAVVALGLILVRLRQQRRVEGRSAAGEARTDEFNNQRIIG